MIKKYFKLNNNLADPKRGMENYYPCGKYDYIYKVMVHNMNYVTKRADSVGTMDASSWVFGGFMAECGGRLIGKKIFGWIFTNAIIGCTPIDTSCKLQQHTQRGSVTRDKQKW
jgi:hypothetical protein